MVRGQKCRSAEYGGQRSFWLGNNRQRMTDKAFFFFLPSYLFFLRKDLMQHRLQIYYTAQAGPELLISLLPPLERQITGVYQ